MPDARSPRSFHRHRFGFALVGLLLALPVLAATKQAGPFHDDEADAPYKVWNSTPAITMPPLLLDVSDTSVVVEWMTDSDADGSVRYGEHALDHTALAAHDGLRDVGTFHRVVIDGLQPGHTYQYQVASRRVVAIKPYWPERGNTVQGETLRFTTLDAARPAARFAVITDTHEKVSRINTLLGEIRRMPEDFVAHLGDTVNWAAGEQQLKDVFLGPTAEDLGGTVPLLYVHGNHEYRGPFARELGPYLHAQNDRYDYVRDDGPLHLIAVDTGEDKHDDTNVYAGLNDLRDYRREGLARFGQALAAPRTRGAPFTVVLGHQPDWGWTGGDNAKWTQLANRAHVDLFIAGHEHHFMHIKPGERGNDFPILVVGLDQVAWVEANDSTLEVRVIDSNGKLVDAFTLARKSK
ncbi:MAG TPA: FN3 domain-containing metallophosphoesterase family protein [Rhodanobacter sp.]|nr:FN3 domain-containing metallophosphoesterase family protein [Rhodanobacter sp.]